MSFKITSGKVRRPFNVALLGVPGIGKSTWAAEAPNPLFLGGEENDEIEAKRLPMPKTFDEFIQQLEWVIKTKPDFETIVIDTIDSIEKLLHKKVLAEDGKGAKSMAQAHGGYGKAYERAETYMIDVRELLKKIRDEMGKNVIILAHTVRVQAVDTTLGMAHDTYEMALHKRAMPVFVDWCSAVFFATYIQYKSEDDNSDKVFALGHGERVMFTEKRPGFLAKNRFSLPYQMPLDFAAFFEAYNAFFDKEEGETAADVYKECLSFASQIDDEALSNKVADSLMLAKDDLPKLKKIRARIKERIS